MGKKKDKEKDRDARKKAKKNKKYKKSRHRDEETEVEKNAISGLKLKIRFGGEAITSSKNVKEEVAEETIDSEDTVVYEEVEEEIVGSPFDEYVESPLAQSPQDSPVELEEETEEEIIEESDHDLVEDEGDGIDLVDNDLEVNLDSEDDEDEEEENKEEEQSAEEQWIEAMEKGDLNAYGEVKERKDKQISMTARQKSLKGEGATELMQLPMYPTEKNLATAEESDRKKLLRAKKRKQESKRKIEETKTQTIEKLLTKGQKNKTTAPIKGTRHIGDHVRYVSNKDGFFLSFTNTDECPIQPKVARASATATLCSMCTNVKKFNCSRTLTPLCSLQCYKLVNSCS